MSAYEIFMVAVFFFLLGGVLSGSHALSDWEKGADNLSKELSETIRKELHKTRNNVLNRRHTAKDQCAVSLPQLVEDTECIVARQLQVNQRKRLYTFSPIGSNGYDFPIVNITTESIILETGGDQAFTKWIQLYRSMYYANQDFMEKWITANWDKDMTEFTDYEELYDSYMQHQKTLTDSSKYFRLIGEENAYCDDIIHDGKWQDDQIFTEQRLAGINPMIIQKVTRKKNGGGVYWNNLVKNLNPEFDWEKAIKYVTGGKKPLWKIIKDSELYVVQYPLYRDMINMADFDFDPRRSMWNSTSPIAFFASSKIQPDYTQSSPMRQKFSRYKLFPVAIQMDHTTDSKVYTPRDGSLWKLAKANVNVADVADVEIIQHLFRTHLFMDRVCVVAKRTLPDLHPLQQILRFHCGAVLPTDVLGFGNLVSEGEQIHQLFAIGWKGARQLLNKVDKTLTWDDFDFYADIKKRGVDSRHKLPYYPFRDDGRLSKLTITHFVDDYVNMYYRSDKDVRADSELQAFVNALSAEGEGPDGGMGQLKNFPIKIRKSKILKDTLSRIIWIASAQHSAVNYPASIYGGFTPNLPTKLYNDSRISYEDFSPRHFVNATGAARQGFLGMVLGTLRYDSLFDYGKHMTDPKARSLVNAYYIVFNTLVKNKIIRNNVERRYRKELTYPFLEPGWIPNSISS